MQKKKEKDLHRYPKSNYWCVPFSSNLMGLLCDLLRSSSTIQQQLLQSKGFLVIAYLLEKVYQSWSQMMFSVQGPTVHVYSSFLFFFFFQLEEVIQPFARSTCRHLKMVASDCTHESYGCHTPLARNYFVTPKVCTLICRDTTPFGLPMPLHA